MLDRSNAASPPIQEGHGGAEDVEHGAGAQGEGTYLVHGGAGGVEVVEDDKPADPADERGQRSEGGKCAQATCGAEVPRTTGKMKDSATKMNATV